MFVLTNEAIIKLFKLIISFFTTHHLRVTRFYASEVFTEKLHTIFIKILVQSNLKTVCSRWLPRNSFRYYCRNTGVIYMSPQKSKTIINNKKKLRIRTYSSNKDSLTVGQLYSLRNWNVSAIDIIVCRPLSFDRRSKPSLFEADMLFLGKELSETFCWY